MPNSPQPITAKRQEAIDRFYVDHGPCCAGCDWWAHVNSLVGECSRSAPMSGAQRLAMLGITGTSLPPGAGHVMTLREHRCGDFKDEFDWSTLPPHYLRRIGRKAIDKAKPSTPSPAPKE